MRINAVAQLWVETVKAFAGYHEDIIHIEVEGKRMHKHFLAEFARHLP